MGTHRSHQCQGFHATPANTPTLWGGISSSTKFLNESWRPPTPSFPPYDVYCYFTSWNADDRGYYTGVEYTPTEVGHIFGTNSWANVGIHKYICYICHTWHKMHALQYPNDTCNTRETLYMIRMTHMEHIIHVIHTLANTMVTFLEQILENTHIH